MTHNFSQCWLFWLLYWFESFQQSCGRSGCTNDEWKWDCHKQQEETGCGWSRLVLCSTVFFCSLSTEMGWIMNTVTELNWEKWRDLHLFHISSSTFSNIGRQTRNVNTLVDFYSISKSESGWYSLYQHTEKSSGKKLTKDKLNTVVNCASS